MPTELAKARWICSSLERFSGYTLQTLLAESAELYRYTAIEALGAPDQPKPAETTNPKQQSWAG